MILEFLKDIIAPKKCYACKKVWHFLCDGCLDLVPGFPEECYMCKKYSQDNKIHNNCKNDSIKYDNIYVFKHYKNKYIKKMIHDGKFYQKKDIFVELADRLSDYFLYNFCIQNPENYVIICPPMNYLKKISRWYNQAEILAKNMANKSGIVYLKWAIKKVKTTRQQSHLSKKQRVDNLKDAFKVKNKHRDKIDKKIILFIDDVISTGTTFNEISMVTNNCGAIKSIWIFIASD